MFIPRSLAGLPARRKKAGFTQQQLADRLGVERGALAMWECGKSWPPARLLPAMADLLLCGIEDLYREEAEAADEPGE